MNTYYYTKSHNKNRVFRITSFVLMAGSILGILYVFSPLILWQLYFAPVFASNSFAAPIPKTTVLSTTSIKGLLAMSANALTQVDYTNADNWFPSFKPSSSGKTPEITSYTLAIPKLRIENATVSTIDHDLSKHLVNYLGTAIPPQNGTAVIFGHSTLPQLFNPKDYKTIFATAYTLKVGDLLFVTSQGVTYKYSIFNITVVDPTDTSLFAQITDTSYLTLVTCTPPGTTWKRLIIKARLEKI